MATTNAVAIDLHHRPSSYFWPHSLEKHLLARVKGAERKATLRALIDAGRIDDAPEFLAKSSLSEDERRAIGRIHPAFMGVLKMNYKRDLAGMLGFFSGDTAFYGEFDALLRERVSSAHAGSEEEGQDQE